MLGLTIVQRKLLFPRYLTQSFPHAGDGIQGLERWWLDIDDGKVEAWFIRGEAATQQAPAPAVIFAHGNGELIEYWPTALARYRQLGISLLLVEYRGYGRSSGTPSQDDIVADFVAFHDRLLRRADVDRTRIVMHGRSLGGGVICALAQVRRPAAVVLTSTFTSVRSMARRYGFPGFMVADPFDSLAVVRGLKLPLAIFHGTRDRVIPVAHSKALHAAAADSRLFLYHAGHNDFPPEPPVFWRDLEGFLGQANILR